MAIKEDKIKFLYSKSKDFNYVYANGVAGGYNDNGEIVANFYFEVRKLPEQWVNEWHKNGNIGKEILDGTEIVTIDRILQTSVILSPENAKFIGEWLIGKAEFAKTELAEKIQPEKTKKEKEKTKQSEKKK